MLAQRRAEIELQLRHRCVKLYLFGERWRCPGEEFRCQSWCTAETQKKTDHIGKQKADRKRECWNRLNLGTHHPEQHKCSTISMHSLTCRARHRPKLQYLPCSMLAENTLKICWELTRVMWVKYVLAFTCVSVFMQPPWILNPACWQGWIVHFFITHIVDSAATRPNKEGDICSSVLAWCNTEVVKEV